MQNFRITSLVVSETDAFKGTYQGAILCIFLWAHDFSQNLDGCKFCTVKDWNLKFSGNAQLLVHCSAHRKEHLTVHYGWSGNAMKTSKISVSLQTPDFEILFWAFGFNLELWFSTKNRPCTNTPYKYRKVWHSCFRYILNGFWSHEKCVQAHFCH